MAFDRFTMGHPPDALDMPTLLNLSIEPARRVFQVSVAMGPNSAVRRQLRVLADTPGGATRIVRQRYPLARAAKVRCCTEAPPELF